MKSTILAPLATICLALAACGGGAAPASSAPPSPASAAAKPSTAAAPSSAAATSAKPAASASAATSAAAKPAGSAAAGGPIKIGWISSLTGSQGAIGKPMDNGFKMYLAEVGNKAGGRDIQVVTEDEASDPKTGLDKVKKLVEQDNVDLLAGLILTPSTYPSVDYLDKSAPKKVLLVGTNAGGNDMDTTRKSDLFVRVSFSNAQANIPMGDYVYNTLGYKNVYLTYSDFAAGPEKVETFAAAFKKLGGNIVGTEKPPLGSTDFAAYLTKIKASNADATYNFEPGADGVAFVKQYSQFLDKNKIKMLGAGDNVDDTLLPAEGPAAVGAVTTFTYYSTLDNPENKKFSTDYQAKYNDSSNAYAVQGYDGAHLIVDALNKTNGSADPKALMGAMLGAKWNSPRGPISISPDYHDVVQNVYVAETKLVNGKPSNVVTKTFEAQQPVAK
ncbi:MAG TPA: ABC transporter substrate-binding protein [Chloroflexota bacterium]|nr:ABC transporter substrate-binding protein [Chloroflexota bacterium]